MEENKLNVNMENSATSQRNLLEDKKSHFACLTRSCCRQSLRSGVLSIMKLMGRSEVWNM